MRKQILFNSLIFFLMTAMASAQLSDLARVDYTNFTQSGSQVGYDRLRGLFNYPIKLQKDGFLLIGFDYSNIDVTFNTNITSFDTEEISDFQLLDLNIAYTAKINEDWRFGARLTPGFSSNLAKELSFEDVVFSSDIVFIKDKKEDSTLLKPYRLILGISYSGNRGIPFPLPFISYYRKFHSKWSYNLGVPKSNLQYHLSERSRFKFIAELDGFTSNIQNNLSINGTDVANRINSSLIIGGLRYEYKFTDHLELFFNFTNIFSNRTTLRDRKNNTILSFDTKNTIYLKTGIRFKI